MKNSNKTRWGLFSDFGMRILNETFDARLNCSETALLLQGYHKKPFLVIIIQYLRKKQPFLTLFAADHLL